MGQLPRQGRSASMVGAAAAGVMAAPFTCLRPERPAAARSGSRKSDAPATSAVGETHRSRPSSTCVAGTAAAPSTSISSSSPRTK